MYLKKDYMDGQNWKIEPGKKVVEFFFNFKFHQLVNEKSAKFCVLQLQRKNGDLNSKNYNYKRGLKRPKSLVFYFVKIEHLGSGISIIFPLGHR